MKITCHTNLDLNPCEIWPNELPCRPMRGDILTSSTGLELEVVRVVFDYPKLTTTFRPEFNELVPHEYPVVNCMVELHLPPSRFENITQFEKWYNARRG